jgi:hypothetical protein
MTQDTVTSGAAFSLSGVLEYRDKDGNIIGTSALAARIPLSDLGISVEEAQQIINERES